MILHKTVFVLGAGASYPYGFPLARDLVLAIYHTFANSNHIYVQLIMECCNKDYDEVYKFAAKLRQSNFSVDAFLENHAEFREIGKAAIACFLIPNEEPENLWEKSDGKERKGKWYEYLFLQMGKTPEKFKQSASNLSIITFNYDRSLEYFFYYSLRNAFDEKFALETLKDMHILHVYGQLGRPIFQTYHYQGYEEECRDYGSDVSMDALRRCVADIKVISERTSEAREFPLAHKLIEEAETLCFLGFGYDSTNVERLEIANHFPNTRLLGTAYESRDDEQRRIKELFKAPQRPGAPSLDPALLLRLGTKDQDVLEFLRVYGLFD